MGGILTLRSEKGSQLLSAEGDANFSARFRTATVLTIATGVVALGGVGVSTYGWYRIDTEAAAAADDLTGFTGGLVGDEILLMSVSSARIPTLKHQAGVHLANGNDFEMTTNFCNIQLKCTALNVWVEFSRVYIP
jgi:hypothetical protein